MPSDNSKYATPSTWAKGDGKTDFTLPNGGVILVQRMSLEDLVMKGIIDDVDAVTSIVESDLIAPKQIPGKKKKSEAAEGLAMLKDPKFRGAMDIMDQVVVGCVVEPQIFPKPAPDEAIDPDKYYVSGIPLEDRTAIFKFIMGSTEKIAQFPAGESTEDLGAVLSE